jgi:hypothetical protein
MEGVRSHSGKAQGRTLMQTLESLRNRSNPMEPDRARAIATVQLVEVADVEALRTSYAAARLEIESLQARIKTMAEEHADELMVAHLDGRMRAAQPAGAQVETAYGATEFGWTDWRNLQDGDKRLKALVVSLFGNDHQAFADLEALIDRASHGQAAPAPAQAIGPCVICGSDEPFTGTCGSGGDPRALCKQPAPQQEAQEPVAWHELCRRLYVELYYCNQQMTGGKRPKWQQGKTVRDVLADAKAALVSHLRLRSSKNQQLPQEESDEARAPLEIKKRARRL